VSKLSERITDAVMEDLRGRKGIFDDIEPDVQAEISDELNDKVQAEINEMVKIRRSES
jgi:hypothetical protein